MSNCQDQRNSEYIGLACHILPVSATMVGVCMTVITVVQIIPKNAVSSWIDALLAVDNLLFLSSAAFSYYSIRHPGEVDRFERRADVIFMFGLLLMVFAGLIVAFDLFIE